ncbi:Tyrosine-protein kinase receptor torso [Strongyloides ratti]|uniref:Tyrosine-protein kinase receptor torso n=1 Tax=Strongyloides ratti TaxID=34506 RepID=A0A090LRU8_STRRB|nr:Tyrosine-protein kinase receptor torso [Strongyloides ratti]CEF70306.1 Tyrosine-protein kinase receptor torso [Strongyloides ratti]
MFNKLRTTNFIIFLLIFLFFQNIYLQNSINKFDSKCIHTYDNCNSWISAIFLFLDTNTDEKSFNDIIKILSNTVSKCSPTQSLSLEIYSCNNVVGNCIGSYDCLELINHLSSKVAIEANCRNEFWDNFKEYYKYKYLNSQGLSSYIVTNYNCSNWENTDLSLFYEDSDEISQYLEEYSVITKLIHITDSDYGGVCIINPIINSSSPLLDVITISSNDINQLSPEIYEMCSSTSSYTINLFNNDLDAYSNCTLYTTGIDEHSCLSYTLFIYFAIKHDTKKDELNNILTLASKVFDKCTLQGTTVIYWSANPDNRYMRCDPSTEACKEKITSLTIYDLAYQNTTNKQIDINSLIKVVNSFDDFKIGQTLVFYIFSNLEDDELSSSLLAQPLFNDSFDYGYFLYKNKIITHFIDLAYNNKITTEKFLHLTNAANEYFVFDKIANISEQLNGVSVTLQICTGDAYYNLSTNNSDTTSSPNTETILLIICGSIIMFFAILASCCIRCRKLTYKFKLSKFSRRFADNEAACEAMEIAHKNKNNKEFQECMDIFNKNVDERYANCPNGCASDRYEMNIDDLAINYNSPLGSGAFACVYKGFIKGKNPLKNACQSINVALDVMTNLTNEVAIKTSLKPTDVGDKTNLLYEIKFMKDLGYHPHIVNIIGCITDWKLPLLVLEYCENEDLLKLLRKQNKYNKKNDSDDRENELTMKDLYSFAWQVADGMVYLSSKNVIHRDIAARNILITKNYVAKIGDFGLCRSTEEINYTTKGGKFPIRWMSYEALKYYTFSVKSDVWAYGILLYEIFSFGEVPYKTVQLYDLVDYLGAGNRLTQPEFCIDEVYKIMSDCWNEDPEKRPTFVYLKECMARYLELNSDSYGYIQLLPDFNKIYLEITETMQKPVSTNKECSIHENNVNDDIKNINDNTKNIHDTYNEAENVNMCSA